MDQAVYTVQITNCRERFETVPKGENNMKSKVLYPGTNSMVRVDLEKGEKIKAESGAMVAMSDTIDVEGKKWKADF